MPQGDRTTWRAAGAGRGLDTCHNALGVFRAAAWSVSTPCPVIQILELQKKTEELQGPFGK